MTLQLQPGDIFLTQGSSYISRAIRFFSRKAGESRTQVNHVGIVTIGGDVDKSIIVEASAVVKKHEMKVYCNDRKTKVAIFRPLNVPEKKLNNIVMRAEGYVGRKYGYAKLVAHFLDWMFGGVYFFRRFAFMDKYPICSWVVAYAYSEEGYTFDVPPGAASPDDIWDFVLANPGKYKMVHALKVLR